MLSENFHLTIQTPEKIYFDGPAVSVKIATETGEIEIFPQHASLMGTILFSHTTVRSAAAEEEFLMRNGLIIVDNAKNTVSILVAACDAVGQADFKSIKEYQGFVLEQLAKKADLNSYQLVYLEEHGDALAKMIEVVKK